LLWAAAAGGKAELLRQLVVEEKLDMNLASEDGWTPLHVAAYFGRRPVLDTLIELGANIEAKYVFST
jgi:ankyrin repeat protein